MVGSGGQSGEEVKKGGSGRSDVKRIKEAKARNTKKEAG
jgi:hypothetical protein